MSDTATQPRATRTTEAKHYGVFERHRVLIIPPEVTADQLHGVCDALASDRFMTMELVVEAWLPVNPDVKADGSRDTDATRKSAVAAAVKDRPLERQRATFATVPAGEWHEYAPPSNLWET
jgi:hypothetical protein